jgi:hypothetical protein
VTTYLRKHLQSRAQLLAPGAELARVSLGFRGELRYIR